MFLSIAFIHSQLTFIRTTSSYIIKTTFSATEVFADQVQCVAEKYEKHFLIDKKLLSLVIKQKSCFSVFMLCSSALVRARANFALLNLTALQNSVLSDVFEIPFRSKKMQLHYIRRYKYNFKIRLKFWNSIIKQLKISRLKDLVYLLFHYIIQ